MDYLVRNFAENQKQNISHLIYWPCMHLKRQHWLRLQMKFGGQESFISEQVSSNMSQLIRVKQASQRRKKRKLKLKNTGGISSALDTPVRCYVRTLLGQEMRILLSYWMDMHRVNVYGTHLYTICKLHRSWKLVFFWLSCICQSWVNGFRRDLAFWSRCWATSWLRRPATHNRTSADNRCTDHFESWESKMQDFFTPFPFCARNCCFQLHSVGYVV